MASILRKFHIDSSDLHILPEFAKPPSKKTYEFLTLSNHLDFSATTSSARKSNRSERTRTKQRRSKEHSIMCRRLYKCENNIDFRTNCSICERRHEVSCVRRS